MNENARVLVVDDQLFIRELITEILNDSGYRVTTAASGEEALEVFRQQAYPVVITDIHMGGVSGFDVLDAIKRMAPETAVVIMSSDATEQNLDRAKSAGAFDFLGKPLTDIDLLSELVARALGGGQEGG